MKTMKKLTEAALALAMMLGGCATASEETTAEATPEATEEAVETAEPEATAEAEIGDLDGGWTINEGDLALDEEAQRVFDQAMVSRVGTGYEPVALLATQVVAGVNYAFLAKSQTIVPDADPEYVILYIYADLTDGAAIYDTQSLADLVGVTEGTDGGWTFVADSPLMEDQPEAAEAFEKAIEGLTGVDYEPYALIAQQVVSGMNYCVFTRSTTVTAEPVTGFALVKVYADLQGNAEITEITDIEIGSDAAETEEVSIANPFVQYQLKEDAEAASGITLETPDPISGYEEAHYYVMNDEMLEVIWYGGDVEAYRIRKAKGSDDISGDYNEYTDVKEVAVDDKEVTLRGYGDKIYVATWVDGDYTYAIDVDMDGEGLSETEVLKLVADTK